LAYVVIANRRYTDLFEWGQRSVPLSLAAEIQHRLLPGAFTCEAGQFTLAAWLQPAGEIGGDTFDFSLDRDALHLSMTDAMGHTMDAALLATVLVGGLRNARRRGVELAEQARLANDALAEQAGESQFVTGLVVRIDVPRRARSAVMSTGKLRRPASSRSGTSPACSSLGNHPPLVPLVDPDVTPPAASTGAWRGSRSPRACRAAAGCRARRARRAREPASKTETRPVCPVAMRVRATRAPNARIA
jgi:hypothetical protein